MVLCLWEKKTVGDSGDTAAAAPAPASIALERTAEQVGQLRKDIRVGQIVLDPAAGEQLKSALRDQLDLTDAWLERARGMGRRVPLGANPVGQAMAEKFQHRAEGADDSCTAVLERYRTALADAHDAVEEAMRRYREVDEAQAQSFTRLAT
ncbi:hypothetical protein GCM10012275_22760 [Longimycelium tulufanense]|uniref:Uncharacterized protein n=1 Tax=Longimycelium tulufanense TaxID=907463 RepID=A0A8J3FVF8_9PSEU|nr:hypothetical protein [Longimycelium tulufanense]GGM51269.1 hypothetical protein GCM10012275_22760 [Longimycelium tulufanense]